MRYIVQRTARAVVTLWVAITLSFVLIRFLPGEPLDVLRGQIARNSPTLSDAQLDSRVQDYANSLGLNPDQSLPAKYFEYVTGVLQGDLGKSVSQSGREVTSIIGEALPWTLFVMTTATILIFAIAIVWGAVVAYKEGSLFDSISSSVSILMASLPSYVLAFFLILVFAYQLGWFPPRATTSPGVTYTDGIPFVLNALHHAALPIASVVLTQFGTWVLSMRGNSIQILGEDYVRVARLRGLSDMRISTRYVARNAILPMYTGFLTLIGFNLGASVVLEQVFRYKGIGWYMFQGLQSNDYALIMGTFIVYSTALVLSVWVADLTYGKIDPRVKSGGQSEAY